MANQMYCITAVLAENRPERFICYLNEIEYDFVKQKIEYFVTGYLIFEEGFALREKFDIDVRNITDIQPVADYPMNLLEQSVEEDLKDKKKIVIYANEKAVKELRARYWETVSVRIASENILGEILDRELFDSIYLLPPPELYFSYLVYTETILKPPKSILHKPTKTILYKPLSYDSLRYHLVTNGS